MRVGVQMKVGVRVGVRVKVQVLPERFSGLYRSLKRRMQVVRRFKTPGAREGEVTRAKG